MMNDTNGGEVLTSPQIDGLVRGNTVYFDVPPGGPGGPDGGEAPMYYGADGYVAARLPTGLTLVGRWRLDDADHYCVDWDNGPKDSRTRLTRAAGAIGSYDVTTGTSRGTVVRIVPGNAEQL